MHYKVWDKWQISPVLYVHCMYELKFPSTCPNTISTSHSTHLYTFFTGVTFISQRRRPDSNIISWPASVPAITCSVDIQVWHRKWWVSVLNVLDCFRVSPAKRKILNTPLPLTQICVLSSGLKLIWEWEWQLDHCSHFDLWPQWLLTVELKLN